MKVLISFLLVSLMLVMSFCTTVINEDLPEASSKLCVTNYFEADSAIYVYVSRGSNIISVPSELPNAYDFFHGVDNATIILREDNEYLTTLTPIEGPWWLRANVFGQKTPGWYTSPVKAKAGKTYRITVSAAGFESISANTYTPAPVAIERVEFLSSPANQATVPVNVHFRDPEGIENYYELFYHHVLILGEEYNHFRSFEGHPLNTTDPTFYQKVEASDDFLDPPQPLPVLFSDKGLDGALIRISSEVSINMPTYENPDVDFDERYVVIEVRSVSKDYYQYKTSKAVQEAIQDDPFAQPSPLYSNINNGLGIFAGITTSTYRYDF